MYMIWLHDDVDDVDGSLLQLQCNAVFSLLTRTIVDEYDVDDEDERNNNKCMKEEKEDAFCLPACLPN